MQDFNFKKKFGQNFISDPNLLNAIASDAKVGKTDEVLEIGAGAGSLTQVLSTCAKKVISFEIDKELQPTLLSLNLPNVEFVFDDFMQADIKEIEQKFSGSFKVVANLPYYITTPIIFKLLENCTKLESLTIMVQKEVAQRAIATPKGDYGILSVMVNFYCDASITRVIGRQMFHPAPNVDSALLHLEIKDKFPGVDKKAFGNFVRTCFSMRRKTLQNNLASKFDKNFLKDKLSQDVLKKRAEEFTVEEFVQMFQKLSRN